MLKKEKLDLGQCLSKLSFLYNFENHKSKYMLLMGCQIDIL